MSVYARMASALLFIGVAAATILLLSARTGRATAAAQVPTRGAVVRFVPDDLQDTSWLEKLPAQCAETIPIPN